MTELKGLEFYIYEQISTLESFDLMPGNGIEISTKICDLLEQKNPYWSSQQLPPNHLYKKVIVIEPISENGYGLQISLHFSNMKMKTIIHEGYEFGKIQNVKFEKDFRFIDFHLDHELLAILLFNIISKCIAKNFGADISFENI